MSVSLKPQYLKPARTFITLYTTIQEINSLNTAIHNPQLKSEFPT